MISTTRSFSPAACLLVAAVTGSAMGDVITVDDDDPGADFATIQEAVDAAVDGDRIEVRPGYYFGDVQTPDPVVKVDGKSIEIVAVNLDPTLTIIAGQGARRCVEWSNTPGDCKLVGFTLDSGYAAASGGARRVPETRGRRRRDAGGGRRIHGRGRKRICGRMEIRVGDATRVRRRRRSGRSGGRFPHAGGVQGGP